MQAWAFPTRKHVYPLEWDTEEQHLNDADWDVFNWIKQLNDELCEAVTQAGTVYVPVLPPVSVVSCSMLYAFMLLMHSYSEGYGSTYPWPQGKLVSQSYSPVWRCRPPLVRATLPPSMLFAD